MAKRKHRNRRNIRRETRVSHVELREIFKLIFVASVVIAAIFVVRGIEDVPIKAVVISTALQNVGKQEIREVATNYARDGFFTVNLANFENELEKIPWVYKASIKRQWPGKLVIAVKEQSPRFRWTGQSLLNQEAVPFLVKNFKSYQQLPRLSGLAGREIYLARLYDQYNERFKRLGSPIASIEEDARYDKVITLVNGISINVGREQTSKQIERCLLSFSEFTETERAAIAGIDLRHSNGFAVRWNG